MKTVFEILGEGLAAQNGRALLIGGYALQVYGVARQTVDVDCLIADAGAQGVRDILTRSGYKEVAQTEDFIRFAHPSGYLPDVDVLLVDRKVFDRMWEESRMARIESAEWRIPALTHLVALKLHAIKNNPKREARDLGDIVELVRANPDGLPAQEVEALCVKHGPKGIHLRLKALL